jgi:exodeoxyribonuclease-5
MEPKAAQPPRPKRRVMTPDWSPQQDAGLSRVTEWFCDANAPQVFRVFGFAGTGKTTLACEIAERVRAMVKANTSVEDDSDSLRFAVLFAAFTGKAALVLRSKGCRGASTIHSLIYRLDDETSGVPRFVLDEASALKDAKLCIIDECSMVGAELAEDLLSFGVKILVLGDPAQLPPVADAGYFTNAQPDVMLTEVHRQAAGNPIIRLSMDVRNGVRLCYGDHGAARIVGWSKGEIAETDILNSQLLVGRNDTRHRMNNRVRAIKKIERDTPVVGEKLVCLKNQRPKNLFNGGIWSVAKLRKFNPAAVRMVIEPEDAGDVRRAVEVKVHPYFFAGREAELTWEEKRDFAGEEFTFGYALTVHKAQGSQWPSVILFDESGVFRDDAVRWLYTGITRAAERLTVVR